MPAMPLSRTFLLALVAVLAIFSFLSYGMWARPNITVVSLENDFTRPIATTQSDELHTQGLRILLVSAFFPLHKSKHTMRDYSSWLSHFLQPITTDIYFFTTPDMESIVRSVRGTLPITINTTFSSPFDIPPLVGLEQRYNEMHEQDREKYRHSPELYAIWNGKPYFLDEALSNVEEAYDYAFWTDAGSFRNDHRYVHWPDGRRIQDIWEEGSRLSGTPKEDLLFFPMFGPPQTSMKFWQEDMGPVDNEFSEGSFFGGSQRTITWWRNLYYTYHDEYLSRNIFVGKDQTLINSLFLLFPSRFITVWLDDPQDPAHKGYPRSCGSEWYYYQFWLALPFERGLMRTMWDSSIRWSWVWWREQQSCGLMNVLSMEGLLRRQFGGDWVPPKASIERPLIIK